MRAWVALIVVWGILLGWVPACAGTTSKQHLTLVLDWFVNPDHATIFVAEEQGFFSEQGLDVEIISPADSNDPPKLVAAGQADIGITYEPQFIDQIEQGLPLLSFGALINQPLNCLLVLKSSGIHSIHDLKGKQIGTGSGGALAIMLKTMLHTHHLSIEDVHLIHLKNNMVQALLAKKVDAITGVMRNIEPQLELSDYQTLLFLPEKNGVPTYSELILVANKNKLDDAQYRLNVSHFLQALEKARAYLIKHPQKCWQHFAKQNPALNTPFNQRAWIATLGYFSAHPRQQNPEEWRAFINFLRQNKIISSNRELNDYIIEIKP